MVGLPGRAHCLGGLERLSEHDRQGRTLNLPIDPDLEADHSHLRPSWRVLALIAIGGSIGAFLRWLLGELIPTRGRPDWPLSTLAVNLLGSALLALLLVKSRRAWIRPLVGTGLLGGFTTFSAVMSQVRVLSTDDPNLLVSVVYLGVTVFLSLAIVVLVFRFFRR